jgi:hypothetical protein
VVLWDNDVRWFNVPMDDGGILTMQVDQRINNWRQEFENLGEGKALIWLLPPKRIQIFSGNIFHTHIAALMLPILKDSIDARQGRMLKAAEDVGLNTEAGLAVSVGSNLFFEGKRVLVTVLLTDQVNGAKSTFTQQCFDHIGAANRLSDDAPYRE